MSFVFLKHDCSFAYDLLAIAQIKARYNNTNIIALQNLHDLNTEIEKQVGVYKHAEVLVSPEFIELCRVNEEMYVRIDELKSRNEQIGDAKYIDDRVYQRWLAKQQLQEKLFGTATNEQKFGYTKQ